MELCPLILDGVEQPSKVKLHSYRFDDELFHLFLEKSLFVSAAGFGSFGNHGADTLVDLEPALLNEVLNGFMRSIRVDFQSACQGSNGGLLLSSRLRQRIVKIEPEEPRVFPDDRGRGDVENVIVCLLGYFVAMF